MKSLATFYFTEIHRSVRNYNLWGVLERLDLCAPWDNRFAQEALLFPEHPYIKYYHTLAITLNLL